MGSPNPELPDTTLFVSFFFKIFKPILRLYGKNQRLAGRYFDLMGIVMVGEAGFSALLGKRVNIDIKD